MGAHESKEVRTRIGNSSISGAVFPAKFNLWYEGLRGGMKLNLGDSKHHPTNVCSLPSGWFGELILYGGPNINSDPVAVAKGSGTLGHNDNIQLAALHPGQPIIQVEMKYWSRGLHIGYSFSAPVGPRSQIERFEWRSSKSDAVRKLGEQSRGWELVRLDYKEEVVAVWSEVKLKMTLSQAAAFGFVGSGLSGELGPALSVVAVTTFLRIWQKKMQLYTRGGIAAGISSSAAAGAAA